MGCIDSRDLISEGEIGEHTRDITSVVFIKESHHFIGSDSDKKLKFWNAKEKKCEHTIDAPTLGCMALSSDGSKLYGGANVVIVFDIRKKYPIFEYPPFSKEIIKKILVPETSDLIYVLTKDNVLGTLNVKKGQVQEVCQSYKGKKVTDIALNPKENRVVFVLDEAEDNFQVADVKEKEVLQRDVVHQKGLQSCAMTGVRSNYVVGSTNGEVVHFDADKGVVLHTLTGIHEGKVDMLQVIPYTEYFVSGSSQDLTLKVFKIGTEECEKKWKDLFRGKLGGVMVHKNGGNILAYGREELRMLELPSCVKQVFPKLKMVPINSINEEKA